MRSSSVSTLALSLCAFATAAMATKVISPRVLIIDFYDDERDIWHGISEFNLDAQSITVPGLSMLYPTVSCTADNYICQMTTGEGEINAAQSTLALILSSQFNLTQTYILTAGDGGINPALGTLGTVTFFKYAVQVALQYEFDARERPDGAASGYVPLGATSETSYPEYIYGTEVFELNDALRQRAIAFAKTAKLNDSSSAQAYRKLYASDSSFAAGAAAPTVVACDTATSDNWWSGAVLGAAFDATSKLFTNNGATYCTTQQEDNAVLEALVRGHRMNRVNFSRVIGMRTGADFDRPPPGMTAADNLFNGQDAGYDPAVLNIYLAGVKVVQGIVNNWSSTYSKGITAKNYVGDIFGSIGGSPNFGPGSIF